MDGDAARALQRRFSRRRLLAWGLGALAGGARASTWASPEPAEPTLWVRDGESIQAAVDRAPPGGAVLVDPGHYHESVLVEKPLTLHGTAGHARTVVTADRARFRWSGLPRERYLVGAINVRDTSDVLISGFTFRGALEGVWASASRRVRIQGCMSCEHTSSGYYLWACQDCTVARCEGSDCAVGIYQGNSVAIRILRNAFRHNRGGRVPHLDDDVYPGIGVLIGNLSRGCRVEGNLLEENLDWGAGVSVGVSEVDFVGNVMRRNDTGLFVGERGVRMRDNNVHQNERWGVDSGVLVDAVRNWWGAEDGPSGAGPGHGDGVTPSVEIRPWRRSPIRPPLSGPPEPPPAPG